MIYHEAAFDEISTSYRLIENIYCFHYLNIEQECIFLLVTGWRLPVLLSIEQACNKNLIPPSYFLHLNWRCNWREANTPFISRADSDRTS